MSSRTKVQECTRRIRTVSRIEEKLDAVGDAINEFAAYIEQMEHLLRNIESRIRRMD